MILTDDDLEIDMIIDNDDNGDMYHMHISLIDDDVVVGVNLSLSVSVDLSISLSVNVSVPVIVSVNMAVIMA
jgi:hypothetical protein